MITVFLKLRTLGIFLLPVFLSVSILSCLTTEEEPAEHFEGATQGDALKLPQGRWWSTDGWDLPRIDTARDSDFLSVREKDFVLGMNMARTNPHKYAEDVVRPLLSCFNGKIFHAPGDRTDIATKEGARPVRELLDYLLTMEPLPPLTPLPGLSHAARDHALDQSKSGGTGHDGSDGSNPSDRISRYGAALGLGECCAYGSGDGERAVLDLLIDDGVPDRGHRLAVMDSKFRKVGVAMAGHPRYAHVAIADMAETFWEPDSDGRIGLHVDEKAWDPSVLDTSQSMTGLPALAKNLVVQINMVRTRPQLYAQQVFARVKDYSLGDLTLFEGGPVRGGKNGRGWVAIGGFSQKNVEEACSLLGAMTPMPQLKLSSELCKAAELDLADLQRGQPYDNDKPIVAKRAGFAWIERDPPLRSRLGDIVSEGIDVDGQEQGFVLASLMRNMFWELTLTERRWSSPRYSFIGIAVGDVEYRDTASGSGKLFKSTQAEIYLATGPKR